MAKAQFGQRYMANVSMDVESSGTSSKPYSSLPNSRSGVSSRNVWACTLGAVLAGSVGALLAVKAIERIGEVFVLPPDLAGLGFGQVPPPEVQAELAAAVFSKTIWNAATWMGIAGAIPGACFAIAIILTRRLVVGRFRMILAVISATASFAAIAGVLGGWLDSIARRHMAVGATSPSEQVVVLIHGVVWLVVGLGLAVGITLGNRQRLSSQLESIVIIGLSGMIGGCLFPIVAGIVFPEVNSSWSIPGLEPSEGRILWLNLPSVLMGVAVGRR